MDVQNFILDRPASGAQCVVGLWFKQRNPWRSSSHSSGFGVKIMKGSTSPKISGGRPINYRPTYLLPFDKQLFFTQHQIKVGGILFLIETTKLYFSWAPRARSMPSCVCTRRFQVKSKAAKMGDNSVATFCCLKCIYSNT